MRIDDIRPYERNARDNARAIPAVAESIREFGLRGTIGLRSREDPTIVWGHTRVAACKSLGWDEVPDSNVEFCDNRIGHCQIPRAANGREGRVLGVR